MPVNGHVGGELPSIQEPGEDSNDPGPEVGVPGTGIRMSQGGTDGLPGQHQQPSAAGGPEQGVEATMTAEEMNELTPNSSGAVGMEATASELDAIQETLAAARSGAAGPSSTSVASQPLAWPTVESDAPLNELTEPRFLGMAFPTLFPTGKAQLSTDRRLSVAPDEYFLHLLRHHSGKF